MLKLQRPDKPAVLTDAEVANLTARFTATGEAVWNSAVIRDPIRLMSAAKCAYCESRISSRNAPYEIDHFYHKDQFPNKVVEWSNLLPCCKGCNTRKGIHNVETEPIINPADVDPRIHLKIVSCFYRHKSDLGKKTLEVLSFNTDVNLMTDVFKLTLLTKNKLEEFVGRSQYIPAPEGGQLTRLRNRFSQLLKTALPSEPYSAILATTILESEDFAVMEAFFHHTGRWDEELGMLKNSLQAKALF